MSTTASPSGAFPPPPGIYVPVPTFFQSTSPSSSTPLPLDVAAQAQHAEYLAGSGIRGLVVLGTTGEAVHLTAAERGEVLKAARRGAQAAGFGGDSYPLVAGTASQSVDEVVEQLAQARRDAAVGWGLCLAPGYFGQAGASEDGVVRWFEMVADRSELPVMVYHYPSVSNSVSLSAAAIVRLAAHPNIVGCKLSHGDVSLHLQISAHPSIRPPPDDVASPLTTSQHFAAFTGLGQHLVPVLAMGFAGAIDGSAGFFPRALVRLYELGRRLATGGADEAARQETLELQYRVSAMENLVVGFGTKGIKEALFRLRGIGAAADATRPPLVGGIPGGDAEWEKWKAILEAVEEVEQRLLKEERG